MNERIKYVLTSEDMKRYTLSKEDFKIWNVTPNWMAGTPTTKKVRCSLDKSFAGTLVNDVKRSKVEYKEKSKTLLVKNSNIYEHKM